MARCLPIVVALACLATATTARADEPQPTVKRYAVVIGSNLGERDEPPLLYAERDAARIADALQQLAGVAPQDLVLLKAPDRATVEAVLGSLRDRIAAERAAGGPSPLLFVYYSGHAGVGSLHLRGTRLTFARLKQLVQGVAADAAVFVLDACRSGGMTRVRGARPAKPFDIKAENLDSQGLAIITSSAAGEDAQESDRLRGGIFTHHFLAGLHGAADASGDQQVTLSEVYRYAYVQTIKTTTRTRFVQHPTYSFQIKGRQELVLSRLDGGAGLGTLRLGTPGRYVLIQQGRGGGLVAEVEVDRVTSVLMPPGEYLIRRRSYRVVLETTAALQAGTVASVTDADMVRVPYGRTVRKGLGAGRDSVWSLGAQFEAGGPLLEGTSPGLFGAVGARVDLSALALGLRFRYGRAWSDNGEVRMTQDMVGLDVSALHLFDVEAAHVAFGLGIRAGVDWVQQSFDAPGKAPDRAQVVGRVAPLLRVEVAPSARTILALEGGVDVYLLEARDGDGGAVFSTPVVPFGSLGFMVYL